MFSENLFVSVTKSSGSKGENNKNWKLRDLSFHVVRAFYHVLSFGCREPELDKEHSLWPPPCSSVVSYGFPSFEPRCALTGQHAHWCCCTRLFHIPLQCLWFSVKITYFYSLFSGFEVFFFLLQTKNYGNKTYGILSEPANTDLLTITIVTGTTLHEQNLPMVLSKF